MRDFERQIRILFHQQNRQTLLLIDFDNFFKNQFDENWGDAERRFVQHQKPDDS